MQACFSREFGNDSKAVFRSLPFAPWALGVVASATLHLLRISSFTHFLQHVLRPRDIVVLSNLDHWYGEDGHEDYIRFVKAKLCELHSVVQSYDALLVLVGPSPWLKEKGFNCVPGAIHPDAARKCEISAQASQLRDHHVDCARSRYLAQFLCAELSKSGWMTNNLSAEVHNSAGLGDKHLFAQLVNPSVQMVQGS